MTERDVFFLVMLVIGLGSLTAFIVTFVRGRRGGSGGGRAGWWEGPWDDDRKR